jgi:hypothetical protein
MGKSYKNTDNRGSSKATKESLKNKNRQINREMSRYAYNSVEENKLDDTSLDSFEDYADDLGFEKFTKNGRR